MAKKYQGKYIGIIVTEASEDPEGRNRVQVWVPHVMNTLYNNWNNREDDKFIFNLDQIPPEELERLRNSLPWAECASFLIGGGTPFATNRETGITSTNTERTLDEKFVPDFEEGVPPDIDTAEPLAPGDLGFDPNAPTAPLPQLLPDPEGQSPAPAIPSDQQITSEVNQTPIQEPLPTE